MTSVKFRWLDFYDLTEVTRDNGLAFFAEGSDHQLYSLVARKPNGMEKFLKIEVYLGKYRGLSRNRVSFEIEMSEESFVSRLKDRNEVFEIFMGEAQDYCERRRPVEFRWVDAPRTSADNMEGSFAS